ncbi:MAG: hypothetical protein C0601_08395 [Candidatus Muiribacterium halophilum]|uniref:histidine kinase n=1 Tax=Muiribacterium halophilum TaxID=2053465 RepID=A0A2N5ZEK5_MUIH1|nr:MAG: hypothetical protein C0601_08395 [Candidatus Muirbacterium halophilum]
MKTKLSKKLLFTYSSFLFIILGISLFIFYKLDHIDKRFQQSIVEYEIIVKLKRIKAQYFQNTGLRDLSPKEYSSLNVELETIRDDLNRLKSLNKQLGMDSKAIENLMNGQSTYQFIHYTETKLKKLYDLNMEEVKIAKNTIYIFVFFGFVSGIMIMFYFAKNITKPIITLKNSVRQSGLIDKEEIDIVDTGDEIELLGNEFNIIFKKLKTTQKELEENNQDLEVRLSEKVEEIQDINKRVFQNQKLSALGRLGAGIAHEIKNPLNVMMNIIHGMDGVDKEEKEVLLKQIRRINELVGGFLDYARAEKYDYKPFDIKDSLEGVVFFFKKANKDIDIDLEIDGEDFKLKGDSSRIEQAFLNILVNSREAIIDREDKKMSIKLKAYDDRFDMEFYDNGKGIDEDKKEKVFDPFFTDRENGNGLGLSIVYNVISMHDGSIRIDSKKDEYTRIIITIKRTGKETA